MMNQIKLIDNNDRKYSTNSLVVLVHGFFKNKSDMSYIQKGLIDYGYDVVSVNLPTTFGSLSDCCNSLNFQINDIVKRFKFVNFVGHSLGCLIIKEYLIYNTLKNMGKCVFIAPPNKGTILADLLSYLPMVDKILKPLKFLKSRTHDKIECKVDTNFPIGVIAGTKNNLLAGKIFLSSLSDGRVEIESTKLNKMTDFVELEYGHKEIHHKKKTLEKTISFLKNGLF